MTEPWPPLPYDGWRDTCDTLHLYTQVVGKVKLALSPFQNQYWHVAFRLTARGLTTGLIPHPGRSFEVEFDFIDHNLFLRTSAGEIRTMTLTPRPVADFYASFMDLLAGLGIEVAINPMPCEIPNAISCETDRVHASYDAESVTRWWRILVSTERVLERFRSGFTGKASPIHFFWGSFDLAHSRFSGRPAPLIKGAPRFLQLSENEENYSCGFWPGNLTMTGIEFGKPAFFAYAYPEPPGFRTELLEPAGAYVDASLGEAILPYDAVRSTDDPDAALLRFVECTYDAAARLGQWDRDRLEIRASVLAQR